MVDQLLGDARKRATVKKGLAGASPDSKAILLLGEICTTTLQKFLD
jgi:hypothetical protein